MRNKNSARVESTLSAVETTGESLINSVPSNGGVNGNTNLGSPGFSPVAEQEDSDTVSVVEEDQEKATLFEENQRLLQELRVAREELRTGKESAYQRGEKECERENMSRNGGREEMFFLHLAVLFTQITTLLLLEKETAEGTLLEQLMSTTTLAKLSGQPKPLCLQRERNRTLPFIVLEWKTNFKSVMVSSTPLKSTIWLKDLLERTTRSCWRRHVLTEDEKASG